jgi:hypothetical protein
VTVVADLSDSALRTEIKRFDRLASELSYRRRVLQGRLDILVAYGGVTPERANLAELSCVLAVNGRRELPALGNRSSELAQLAYEERALSRRRRVAYAMVEILRGERVRRLRCPSFE